MPGPPGEATGSRRAFIHWIRLRGHWLLLSLAWVYAAMLLVVILAIRLVGERCWFVTLLMFIPRYIWMGPVLPLLVAAGWLRSARLGLLVALNAALVAIPLMGFTIPWTRWITTPPTGPGIRILTLNRGRGQIDFAALNRLIAAERIDILCFQEAEPPGFEGRLAPGYHWNVDRRIASRFRILREDRPEIPRCPGDSDLFARVPILTLQLPGSRRLRIALIDMPSMSAPFSELFQGRFSGNRFREQTSCRREYARALLETLTKVPDPLVLAGDFNAPPDSDVLTPFLARWTDSHSEAGFGLNYTWPGDFRFLRLDRIMRSDGGYFTRAEVGPPVGSDHRPYWAELILQERESTSE